MSETSTELRLVTWNVNRSSVARLGNQLDALGSHAPDIVALQEVGVKASRRPRQLLREHGFEYAAHSHEVAGREFDTASGVAFASRWPFRVLDPETFDMPFQHHALSAKFSTPFGDVEGHTVHVLPGSQYGVKKVEMFEGIYDRLARDDPPDYRFLCGDFNAPESEHPDGTATMWGDERQAAAERSVLRELVKYDLADAYRAVHDDDVVADAYSFVTRNDGTEWHRRFDHVFASERLGATDATYLHQYDDLSDHTPLEVVFTPVGGLDADAEAVDRSSFTPADVDARATETETASTFRGLTYEEDERVVDPDANYRRGRFKAGWNAAVDGAEYDGVLATLTWENLGWRCGMLFGAASEDQQEALYEWCVAQQIESDAES